MVIKYVIYRLILDMFECATGEVKEESKKMLIEFKKTMRELQVNILKLILISISFSVSIQ